MSTNPRSEMMGREDQPSASTVDVRDSDVLVEHAGHTLLITINREHARNAVNTQVWRALGAALREADLSFDVRSVVLTGSGNQAFCAGLDLKSLASGEFKRDFELSPEEEAWGFAGITRHEISKPIIAAVEGMALGGGWEIVLACDLVVASENAKFGLPEVQRGLIAGGGGAFRLARQLPRALSMEILLTGDPIDARTALGLGLINSVVPSGDALTTAMALAERINANAPLAVQATKRIARESVEGKVASEAPAWLQCDKEVRQVVATEDAHEGPKAFIEKRAPRWVGR